MPRKSLRELSPRERQVMDVVYRLERATVNEILDAMEDPPSYSAVRAVLRVLEEKGQVRHSQDGPRYVYRPVVEPERAGNNALSHVVQTFFDGRAEQAALALLKMSDSDLSEDEVRRLADRIEDARREGR
ncbi:MAG: BlaI/MecI/CopY family transcriptional regulator [Gemmatimonadota bacterium]|nr:BlaI/MecI/CopY family transcriptional regulator [Gemmatimonadota bacterium]